MTTSAYMSDVKVEIAFTSTFSTPAGSRVWVDVSQWVELSAGIDITYGRSDERSKADANTLALTLDNSDGRFTPDRTSSPYFPNVRLYRPIRVTATPPGGTPSVRFVGYINQWPTAWAGSDSYAMSTLAAASRLSRLSLGDARKSTLEDEVLADRPAAYWALGEEETATSASDSSSSNAPALRVSSRLGGTKLAFSKGLGPLFASKPAVQFAAGQILDSGSSPVPAVVPLAVEVWTAMTDYQQPLFLEGAETSLTFNPFVGPDYGAIIARFQGQSTSTQVFAGGILHHFVMTIDGGQFKVYVDGALYHSAPFTGSTSAVTRVIVGNGVVGSASHLAYYDHPLTAGRVAAHYAAGTTGIYGETTQARLTRYAGYAGVPSAEIVTQGVTQTHVGVDAADRGVVDLMRQLEDSESAVLYDQRDGRLALVGESVRYAATPAFVLDMVQQHVESDFAPQHDPSTILNDCTVTQVGSGVSARVVNAASRDEFGVAAASFEATSTNDEFPLQLATWQVMRYAQPKTRIPSVTVDVTAQADKTPSPGALLDAGIHSLITVTNQPSQAQATTASYFIEGYSESIGVESHVISFNVSPAEPFTRVFLLDDPVRGALDGSYVLGL